MHKIYDQSLLRNLADRCLSRPVALATAFIARRPKIQAALQKATGARIVDVERDIDIYARFAVTKAQVVKYDELSLSQKHAIEGDDRYNHADGLYLVTMVGVPDPQSGKSWQRDFICDESAYNKLGIAVPTYDNPIGDGTGIIEDKVYNVGTKGQLAFATVPRVHEVVVRDDSDAARQDISGALKRTERPTRRMRLRFFAPKP